MRCVKNTNGWQEKKKKQGEVTENTYNVFNILRHKFIHSPVSILIGFTVKEIIKKKKDKHIFRMYTYMHI